MKTGNIGIRDVAGIGVSDIDVYGTNPRDVELVTPKIILFFRSEDQANGLPKQDKNSSSTTTYLSNTIKDILEDQKYDESFGFDFFRENILGSGTKVYKIDENKKGHFIYVKDSSGNETDEVSESDTGNTIESFYDKTLLSLELVDKNKTFFINEDFKLKKGSSLLKDKAYYAPNILIKPGKEVKIFAKFFHANSSTKLAQVVEFKLSNAEGIESFTNKITFNKNEEINEIKIKTKVGENVEKKSSLIAFVKDVNGADLEIGRMTILPNKLFQPKLIFVDVSYKKQIQNSTNNYQNLLNDINNKAFNQVSVNFTLGKKRVLNTSDTDFSFNNVNLLLGSNFIQKVGTQDFETISNNSLDGALAIIHSKFIQQICSDILSEIEVKLQNLEINDGVNKRKLIPQGKTLQGWFEHYYNSQLTNPNFDPSVKKWFNKLYEKLYYYIEDIRFGFYPIYICDNIFATKDQLAVGYVKRRGLIVPKNAVSDLKTIIHELGHNMGLRHTFDKNLAEKGDIKIKPMNSLENIMDYLNNGKKDYAKNFITFQILRIRENLENLRYDTKEMMYKIEKETHGGSFPVDVIKDFSNNLSLELFSKELCNNLFQVYIDIYKIKNDTKLESHRGKILTIFVETIENYLKNL